MLGGLGGGWRVARVVVVVAVTALAIWFTRRAGRAGQGTTALLLGIAGTAAGAVSPARTWPKPAWTRLRSWRPSCWSLA
jgi:hypothetical protein